MNKPIIITESDAKQLRSILDRPGAFGTIFAESANRLAGELDRAAVVSDTDLPEDVITLNSTVEVEDLVDHELLTFTLVTPETADVSEGRISVLAPIGMALLGYRVGDEIEWPVPGGTARMRIRKHLGRHSVAEAANLVTH